MSDTAYENWHQQMAHKEEHSSLTLYPWHETVLRLLPPLDHKRVLEIGCGRGDFALTLAQRFPSATIAALDFSERAVDIARDRAQTIGAKVDFTTGNAESLPFEPGSFDFVVSCECMEHVPVPQKMANEIARCLRSGGEFIVTTENYFNGMLIAWLKSWITRQPFDSGSGVQPRENFFLFWRVRNLFRKAGLRVTHTESNHFQWLLLPRCSPRSLCTTSFRSAYLNRLFRPFGRHFTFQGVKPKAAATGDDQTAELDGSADEMRL
jgi:ubiquinone/menaquinone biosynthesis C-methylase UbiE